MSRRTLFQYLQRHASLTLSNFDPTSKSLEDAGAVLWLRVHTPSPVKVACCRFLCVCGKPAATCSAPGMHHKVQSSKSKRQRLICLMKKLQMLPYHNKADHGKSKPLSRLGAREALNVPVTPKTPPQDYLTLPWVLPDNHSALPRCSLGERSARR